MMRTFLFFSSLLCVLWGCVSFVGAADIEKKESGDGLPLALQLAVTGHPSIISKEMELQALGYETSAAKARRYPTLSVQAQSMSDKDSQVIGRIQQPIWVGGRIDDGIRMTDAKRSLGAAGLLQIQRQIMEETAAVYAILQGARLRHRAAVRNVEEHEKLLSLISRRQVGKIASEADVRLATSRLIQAISQREQLLSLIIKAENDLLALTQVPVSGDDPIPEEWSALPVPDVILDEIQKMSATVRLKEREVEVVKVDAELQKDNMMPNLYARFDQDLYVANEQEHLPNQTRIGLVLEGSMEGAGFANWHKVSAAKGQIRAAEQNVASANNDVRRRAHALLADLEMLKRLTESSERIVAATEETLQSFMRQYDAGRKTWVDVLNSQKELSEAWQGLEQSKSSFVETSMRLTALMGRFDQVSGVPR